MKFRYQFQKILLVAVTTVVVTSAMKCDKLIDDSGSVGNTGVDMIMDTGRYVVNTTSSIKSQQVQSLIERLNGASDIQYMEDSFTAILEPKDLKKVHRCCSIVYL